MFNAPAIIFLTVPKKSPAHSMVSYPDLVRKYAKIPEDEAVGMAIAVGYIDKNAEINNPKFIPARVPFEKIYKLTK